MIGSSRMMAAKDASLGMLSPLFNTQMVTLQQQLQLALAAKAAAAPKPAE